MCVTCRAELDLKHAWKVVIFTRLLHKFGYGYWCIVFYFVSACAFRKDPNTSWAPQLAYAGWYRGLESPLEFFCNIESFYGRYKTRIKFVQVNIQIHIKAGWDLVLLNCKKYTYVILITFDEAWIPRSGGRLSVECRYLLICISGWHSDETRKPMAMTRMARQSLRSGRDLSWDKIWCWMDGLKLFCKSDTHSLIVLMKLGEQVISFYCLCVFKDLL